MVIWITGLSGAGKSTLCQGLVAEARARAIPAVSIDGDDVREMYAAGGFGAPLGHHEEDRRTQIVRLQGLARLLDRQGLLVVVTAVIYRRELFEEFRRQVSGFFEILIDAPLPLVEARDSKGIYAAARRGEMKDVVGIDIPWTPPETPDLRLDAKTQSPEEMVAKVAMACPAFGNGQVDGPVARSA